MTQPVDATATAQGTLDASETARSGSTLDATDPQVGERFGRYVVIEKLGAGGMGVVFAAFDPELGRRVAIKLLLPGGNAARGAVRLMREAQALARVSHPNIVAIHDVGMVGDGVYVAMEYVDGITLRGWLDEKRRPREAIIEVFEQAGAGLSAAHANGLVHRDFKPDNVMLGEDGRVRVMDFGLARAVDDADQPVTPEAKTESSGASLDAFDTPLTRTGAVLGTPAYMSPEQHLGVPADARTDQFSFCVTLWEALCGERPFHGATMAQLALAVTQGKRRPVPDDTDLPKWLRRAIERGLETDAERRWPTMDLLVAALRDDPTRARTRVLALTGTLAVAAAAGGAWWWSDASARSECAATAAGLTNAWEQRRGAIEAAWGASDLAFAARTFNIVDTRAAEWASRWGAAREQTCVARHESRWTHADVRVANACLRALERGWEATIDTLASPDEGEVVRHATTMVTRLGMPEECTDLAFARVRPVLPEDDPRAERIDAVMKTVRRAESVRGSGDMQRARSLIDEAMDDMANLDWPPLEAATRFELGKVMERQGELDGAERLLEQAFHLAGSGGDEILAGEIATELAYTIGYQRGRIDDGLRWIEHATMFFSRAGLSGDDERAARLAMNRGSILTAAERFEEAEAEFDRALAVMARRFGEDHPALNTIYGNLAIAYFNGGKLDDARTMYERSLAMRLHEYGEDHPDVGDTHNNLGMLERASGDFDAAREHYERAGAIYERALGPEHPAIGDVLNNLGILEAMSERWDVAGDLFARSLAIRVAHFGAHHRSVAASHMSLAKVAAHDGDWATVRDHERHAFAAWSVDRGPAHPRTLASRLGAAEASLELGEHDQARLDLAPALTPVEDPSAEIDAELRAGVLFAEARAMLGSGRPREDAITVALRAREALGDAAPELAARIDAFIRE